MPKPKTIADEVLDSLERKGLAKKNGKFRMEPTGDVQPPWVITPLCNWLGETGQLNNYLSTWKTDLKS
jgi:hypothetical protein